MGGIKKRSFQLFCLNFLIFLRAQDLSLSFDNFKKILPENPIIVEAGAFRGAETLVLSSVWPEGMIFSFEPLSSSYNSLVDNIVAKRNVFTFPLALSNKTGENIFYEIVSDKSLSSLFPLNGISDIQKIRRVSVSVTTLDSWCWHNSMERIDLLWLDMDGAELNALKGARKILKTTSFIYTEVHLKSFWHGAPLFPDLRRWLKDQGFHVVWIKFERGDHGKALFAKNEFLTLPFTV